MAHPRAVTSDRSMGYINPLFKLPAARGLLALDAREKAALGRLMMELRHQANDEAERAWTRRKGPMACYWRAVSTYARHVAHVLGQDEGLQRGALDRVDGDRLQRELAVARRQVTLLVEAASLAVPSVAHPTVSSPESWARLLRSMAVPLDSPGAQLRHS